MTKKRYMTTPQMTLEIRWFFPGTIPENEVEDWFLDNPRFGERLTEKHGKTREDIYLLTPGNSDIGAKLREGKFEIKLLQNQQEYIDPAGGVSGKSEVWHKWKWPYARTKKDKKINEVVTNSFLAKTPEKLRVTIWKQRWQRKFKPASPEDLAPVPKSQKDLSWRISAELTGLQIKGAPWWTMAIEVCENPDNPSPFFQQSVHWMLQDYPGPLLQIDNSSSYPEWLALL